MLSVTLGERCWGLQHTCAGRSLSLVLVSTACMQACEKRLVQALPEAGTDWMAWLELADRLQLKLLAARCVQPVIQNLIRANASGIKGKVLAVFCFYIV